MANRDDFTDQVKRVLSQRVGNSCSNPRCGALTSGPTEDPAGAVNVGVAAHITAAASGGPRYDPARTPEQRKAAENGILLCQTCAKRIDDDPIRFSVDVLRGWKSDAEAEADQRIGMTVPAARGAVIEITAGRPGVGSHPEDDLRWVLLVPVIVSNLGDTPTSIHALRVSGTIMNLGTTPAESVALPEAPIRWLETGGKRVSLPQNIGLGSSADWSVSYRIPREVWIKLPRGSHRVVLRVVATDLRRNDVQAELTFEVVRH